MKHRLGAGFLLCSALTLQPIAARACIGDCNGDGTVTIDELIKGTGIALGQMNVAVCTAMDANGDGSVTVSELITAVNSALNGCLSGPTVTLTGSCVAPGTGRHGLKPCDPGTVITVFRGDDRSQCLHQQGLTVVGATTVADDGGWSVQIAPADAQAALVFQASIDTAVVYRTLGFGMVGSLLRSGRARAVTFAPVAITPATEAAVELLDDNGFENYSDTGAQEVLSAVEQATADVSFDGLTPEMAAQLAVRTASDDPDVRTILQTARNTPTPTVTPTGTPSATRTPPHSLVFVGNSKANVVYVVDGATGSIAKRVTVGEGPLGMALTPDGKFVLVANGGVPPTPTSGSTVPPCGSQRCPDTVSIIDTASQTLRATIPDCNDAEDDPNDVAVTADGRFAYVTNNLSDSISVVDLNRVLVDPTCAALSAHISLGQGAGPVGVVAARQQPYVYVANRGTNTVSVIDTRSNTEITARQMPGSPTLLALTSDDATLYVTLQDASSMAVVDTAKLRTPGVNPVRNTVPVGGSPAGVAISGDDQTIYVANSGADTLSVISSTPGKGGTTVPLLSHAQPVGVALSADSRVAYVTNCQLSSVSFIDTTLAVSAPQNAILRTVQLGGCPQGLVALDP